MTRIILTLYDHRRVPFHSVELNVAGRRRAEILQLEIANFWHAPFYSIGRGRMQTTQEAIKCS